MKGVPAPEIRSKDGAAVLVGYGAMFSRYSQNLGGFVEQVAPKAFDDTLTRSHNILARGNHDPNWLLGSTESGTLALSTDDVGLRYEVQLDQMDPDSIRAMRKVETGLMPGSSFRFRKNADGDKWGRTDQGYPLRTLTNVDLLDVGPVFNPAYKQTEGSLSIALRSLSESLDVDVQELISAAESGELRSYPLPGDEITPAAVVVPTIKEPEPPVLYRRYSGLSVPISRNR